MICANDMHNSPAVELEHASVRAGGRPVWSDVSLTVAEAEFVAILGPNGAGKSTLLKALPGVVPLSAGTVRVFGKPVRRGNDEIGYLPQRRRFDADLRIRASDLVRLGLDGDRWGVPVPSPEASRRVEAMLELVGLNNQQAISALIRGIGRRQGVTVLLVAHDINPILPFIDRVVYVAGGRVVSGKPADVIRTDTLTRLYGAPVEVLHTSDGRLIVVGQYEAVSHHPEGA
jgi:zinc/manganese transport system ATP-binding protein